MAKGAGRIGYTVQLSPIRHHESNRKERIMREHGKYFKIYCNQTHKTWPDLVPYRETWLNSTVCQSTGYAPIKFYGQTRHVFLKVLK
jgi:hypothetical protein